MALALYRKYRPKTFAQIHGQETIVTVLKNAAAQDRIAHAYLFCGMRGTGKTTAARILAKTANCFTRRDDTAFKATGEPCNACAACLDIDTGTTLDVMEMDAASHGGVDEIRNLKETALVAPSYYAYKVFIIDEAHALSKSANNALLKLLEEPPAHAIFILATTEPEKLLPTIVSRTQKFDFKKLGARAIFDKLSRIAKEEGLAIDDAALRLIALAAEGSVRDAESMLDQVMSYGLPAQAGLERITTADVEDALGKTSLAKIAAIVDALLAKDASAALAALHALHEDGGNLTEIADGLLRYLRRLLALHIAPSTEEALRHSFTDEELSRFADQAARLDPKTTMRLMKALLTAIPQMRYTTMPIVPLEVAILEAL